MLPGDKSSGYPLKSVFLYLDDICLTLKSDPDREYPFHPEIRCHITDQ